MAAEERHASAAVAGFLDAEPWAWDFFQAVRRLESQRCDLPRVGTSLHPAEDAVRFGQEPTLAFPPNSLARLEREEGLPPRLLVHFLGLLGCNGPMPLSFTEYVFQRLHHYGDQTLARFLDLFHHRMISLFYRAWAVHQQTVSFDRGEDPFGQCLASLIGRGSAALRECDAVPDVAKLHYSGRLACPTRHAAGLRAILEGYFLVRVTIEEFVGQWLELPAGYRCRLGRSPESGRIGATVVVGSRVWGCQQRFRLRLGPLLLTDYLRFLPGTDTLKRLRAWVWNYCGLELEWELQLLLRADAVPRITLGTGPGARLGHTTWLHSQPFAADVGDLVLGPFRPESVVLR
jgi:type VI secretion system protein ImpH